MFLIILTYVFVFANPFPDPTATCARTMKYHVTLLRSVIGAAMASLQTKSILRLIVVLLLTYILLSVYFSTDSTDGNVHRRPEGPPTSTKCLEYSPAFPSVGGPGCSPKCISDGNKRNSSYGVVYYNSTGGWPKELVQNIEFAGNILKKHGPLESLKYRWMKVEGLGGYLHVSLDYYCCYSTEEGVKIGEFINNYKWTPQTVRFGEVVCAIHGHGGMVSIVLMLDEESQTTLRNYALQSEADFEQMTGLKKHIPHTRLQGHHMTLATVNQSLFPVRPAIDEINRTIPPGHWHPEPIVLIKDPLCRRCEKAKRLLEDSSQEKK